jgi:3-oxoadipate enol-lactonase
MPFVHVRGLEMYYELGGAGERLLFINGTGGDLRQKPNFLDGPISGRFESLGYDQRGLGQTSKPAGPYTMADYGDDAAALMDALGWESAHVFGVSFGGMVAQHLAIRHPARIQRLVLACTSSGGEGGASYPLDTLADLPEDERALVGIELADTRYDAAWREREPDAFAAILKMMTARGQVTAPSSEAEAGAAAQLEARSHHDVYEQLSEIGAPTYICGGHFDGIAPVSNQEALASRIPNATLELFDGGHLFLMQDAKAFPRIIEFLEGTS